MPTGYITTAEAAAIAGYHPKHIQRLIRAGKIKAKKWGIQWQVKKSSLLTHIRSVEKLGAKRGAKPKS